MKDIVIRQRGRVCELLHGDDRIFTGGRCEAKRRAKALHLQTGDPVWNWKCNNTKVQVTYKKPTVMSKKYHDRNPRFVWNIGAIAEAYPDMAGVEGMVLYDRQERVVVAEVRSDYANAICLELNHNAESQPFTNLENWFNACSNAGLVSEGIPGTK